jgi:hypothetical protein
MYALGTNYLGGPMQLDISDNEATALTSALSNYLDGHGMDDVDEDEDVLMTIYMRLSVKGY